MIESSKNNSDEQKMPRVSIKPFFMSSIRPIIRNYSSFAMSEPTIDFTKVCLLPAIESQIVPYVRYLIKPQEFQNMEPKGIVFSGPPGTGKTMIPEAIAGQAGVPYLLIASGALASKYVGETQQKLRDIFKLLEKNSPCVVCFDEFDSIARARTDSGTNTYQNDVVNQLLTLLTEKRSGVIVTATTNSEQLDPAVVRPGRFDRTIYIDLPTFEERKKILAINTQDKVLSSNISLGKLAKMSAGFSGAKLASWVKEASIQALLEQESCISFSHFFNTYVLAIESTAPQIEKNVFKRRITATHEIGHALIAHAIGRPPIYVSVMRNHGSLGRTLTLGENPLLIADVLNSICLCLGGIAAEELYNIEAIGAADDLAEARKLASRILTSTLKEHEPTATKEILMQQLQRAKQILLSFDIKLMNRLITALTDNHYLTEHDFLSIIEGRPLSSTPRIASKPIQMPEKRAFLPRKTNPDTTLLSAAAAIKKNLGLFNSIQSSSFEKLIEENLTIAKVAKALQIPPNKLLKLVFNPLQNRLEIKFQPSVSQDIKLRHHLENSIIDKLCEVDIEANCYINAGNYLSIKSDFIDKFIEYANNCNKKAPSSGVRPR